MMTDDNKCRFCGETFAECECEPDVFGEYNERLDQDDDGF